jgi:tetratricopeptide (TPR) repeat protein
MKWTFLLVPALLCPLVICAQMQPDLVAQAESKKSHGDFKGALTDYSQAITADPKNARAYIGRATVLSLEGNYTAAIADDTEAIALDPKNPVAYSNRGNARLSQADLVGALKDYTEAIKLDPHHVHAFINRGNVKNLQKKYAAAIVDYSEAITLDPKSAVAYYNRAGAKAALGKYADASGDYSEAITLNPVDVPAYIDRAIMEMTQKNWGAATTDLNKCLTLLPASRQAYPRIYLWVIAAQQNGETSRANLELAKAADFVQKPLSEMWGWQIAKFLAGQIEEPAFLTAITSPGAKTNKAQKSKAYYFAGLKRELTGDKLGAAKFFHECVATGDPSLHEYLLAREELKNSGDAK